MLGLLLVMRAYASLNHREEDWRREIGFAFMGWGRMWDPFRKLIVGVAVVIGGAFIAPLLRPRKTNPVLVTP